MSYPGNCVWKSEIEGAGEKYFICFVRSEMMEKVGMHRNFLYYFLIIIPIIIMYFVYC